MSSFLAEIETFILGRFPKEDNAYIAHAVQQGKRVRPHFLEDIISYYDIEKTPFVPAGAAIELIHAGSLIHDDIADADDTRREKPSFASQFGITKALLYGDYLLAEALSILSEHYPDFPLSTNGLCVLQEMIHAQWEEANNRITNEGEYLSYIHGKTTTLFEFCARIPPVVSGKESLLEVERFATLYGTCFQLLDDLSEEHPENELNILNFVTRPQAMEKIEALQKEMRVPAIISSDKWIFP